MILLQFMFSFSIIPRFAMRLPLLINMYVPTLSCILNLVIVINIAFYQSSTGTSTLSLIIGRVLVTGF